MKLDRIIAVRNTKTVYRDGDRCIKVFGPQYSKADVLQEALNHARVEETGLLLPPLLDVTRFDGKWAIVTEYIRGKTLSRMMEEQPEKMREHLQLFVRLHESIHDVSCTLLRSMTEKIQAGLQSSGLEPAMIFALQQHLRAMPDNNQVCHGDFDPSNVIVAENGNAYLLDWSRASKGNEAADVAATYLLLKLQEKDALARQYMDIVCDSLQEESEVRKWLPLAAAARLERSNEQQREKLLQWIRL